MKNLIFTPAQTIKKGLPGSAKSAVKGILTRGVGVGFPWKTKPGVFFNLWAKMESPVKKTTKAQTPIVIPVNQTAAPLSGNGQKIATKPMTSSQTMVSSAVSEASATQTINAQNVNSSEPFKKIKILETEVNWPVAGEANLAAQFQNNLNPMNLSPIVNKLIQAAVNSPDSLNLLSHTSAKIVKVNFVVEKTNSNLFPLVNQNQATQEAIKPAVELTNTPKTSAEGGPITNNPAVAQFAKNSTLPETMQLPEQKGTLYLKNLTGLMWQPVEQEQEAQQILKQLNLQKAPELNVRIQAVSDASQTNLFKVSVQSVTPEISQQKVVSSNQTAKLQPSQGATETVMPKVSLKTNPAEVTAEQVNPESKTLESMSSGKQTDLATVKTSPTLQQTSAQNAIEKPQVTNESKTIPSTLLQEQPELTELNNSQPNSSGHQNGLVEKEIGNSQATLLNKTLDSASVQTNQNKTNNAANQNQQPVVDQLAKDSQPNPSGHQNGLVEKEIGNSQATLLNKTLDSASAQTNQNKTNNAANQNQQPAADQLAKNSPKNETQKPLNLILKVEAEENVQGQTSSETLTNLQKTSNPFETDQQTTGENKSRLLKIQIHQLTPTSNGTLQNMESLPRQAVKNITNMDQFIARIKELVDQVQSTKLQNGSIRMSLDETPMGKIDMKFQQHERQLTVVVENEQIRNELVKLTPVIQQHLADKGITLNSFQVNVGQFAQSEQGKQMASRKRGQTLNPLNTGKEVGHHESQSTLANRKFGYNTMEITV